MKIRWDAKLWYRLSRVRFKMGQALVVPRGLQNLPLLIESRTSAQIFRLHSLLSGAGEAVLQDMEAP